MIALVLGGAECLQADITASLELVTLDECVIVAVNDAGIYWPYRLDHWATMHPTEIGYRIERRRMKGYPMGFTTWTNPYPFGMKDREQMCDRVLDGYKGSSGLLGLGVALEEGCHATLCGIPMDVRPHFNREGVWSPAESFRERWIELHDEIAPRVRSWSGWTRDQFGSPTADWLDVARSSPVHST